MKVIALYLPQYHQIIENDLWWGEGFTEWISLQRGRMLIDGQYQPRIPQNNNYYDLSDINVMKWQVNLAKENGIYGFCFYHYWFNGKLLLEKPIEQYLEHKEIDFPYYICWANEQWTTIWEGEENPRNLISHEYDNKDEVDKHFEYLLNYIKDERYMKNGNRPILSIYNPISIEPKLLEYMVNRWNELARMAGFDGISFIYLCAESMCFMGEEHRKFFDYGVEYEPSYVEYLERNAQAGKKQYQTNYLIQKALKKFPLIRTLKRKLFGQGREVSAKQESIEGVKCVKDYDEEWNKILNIRHDDYSKYIPGGFTDWDNTPRRGRLGKVILGGTPEKFEKYFERLVKRAKEVYKTDTIVIFAWNEWSEGGYLEPDEKWGDGYLKAIRRVLEKTN